VDERFRVLEGRNDDRGGGEGGSIEAVHL
jgi:hypothetical protein